jgi:NAD(P)H-dependent flavin oxidoreductase YrpB (nitropropane dioxygenase family)
MLETAFTRLVGCRAPIQSAAMPAITTPELVCAVADAGGLAMQPAPLLSAEGLGAALDALAARTRGVVGVGFLMPFLDRECLRVAARKARVVEFFYGAPDAEIVREARANGALASWQVGSLDEALAAERCGCDLVVAQGREAGGHVRGVESLLPLLASIVARVRVPVLAAGGIATEDDLAAVLEAGAAGARLGTRFVACTESGAHPEYVKALLAARAADTVLTEAFSVMWPHAPHRVLRSAIAAAERLPDGPIGVLRTPGGDLPVPRFGVYCPNRDTTGHIDAMALYAGESVERIASVEPAGAIVDELVRGAEARLAASGRSAASIARSISS